MKRWQSSSAGRNCSLRSSRHPITLQLRSNCSGRMKSFPNRATRFISLLRREQWWKFLSSLKRRNCWQSTSASAKLDLMGRYFSYFSVMQSLNLSLTLREGSRAQRPWAQLCRWRWRLSETSWLVWKLRTYLLLLKHYRNWLSSLASSKGTPSRLTASLINGYEVRAETKLQLERRLVQNSTMLRGWKCFMIEASSKDMPSPRLPLTMNLAYLQWYCRKCPSCSRMYSPPDYFSTISLIGLYFSFLRQRQFLSFSNIPYTLSFSPSISSSVTTLFP